MSFYDPLARDNPGSIDIQFPKELCVSLFEARNAAPELSARNLGIRETHHPNTNCQVRWQAPIRAPTCRAIPLQNPGFLAINQHDFPTATRTKQENPAKAGPTRSHSHRRNCSSVQVLEHARNAIAEFRAGRMQKTSFARDVGSVTAHSCVILTVLR